MSITIKKLLFPLKYLLHALRFGCTALYFSSTYERQMVISCMANPCMIGGTELQFKLISTHLLERGLLKIAMTAGVVDKGRSNQTIGQLKENQVFHLAAGVMNRINYNKYPRLKKMLIFVFRQLNTQILHIFNPSSSSLIPIAKLAGMRVVYTETGLPEKDAFWGQLAPYINDLDHVISVSTSGLEHLRNRFDYQGPGTVISTIIEPPLFTSPPRVPKEGTFKLIYFGRIVVGKGLNTLLQAFQRVISTYPYSTLTIVGEGPHLTPIKQLSKELNLEKGIRFLDCLDREMLFHVLADTDVFCLPSLSEGCPCSIIEAMSIGLPVIATQVGGIPELVIHEETGLLVPHRDVNALTEAIFRLAADPTLRMNLGRQGMARYQERLSHPVAIEKLIAVYKTLL